MSAQTEQDLVLAALEAPEKVEIPNLVVGLMAANHRDYVSTTNRLVESLQRALADREAELAAIRVRVNELFAGDFMPTESAIQLAVFYPSKSLMARLRVQASPEGEVSS